jgi:hypothetical protein
MKCRGTYDESIPKQDRNEKNGGLSDFDWFSEVRVEGILGSSATQMDKCEECLVYNDAPVLPREVSVNCSR